MKYISLFKQYAIEKNISDFENIYTSRFNSESSYHFPVKINGYDAFLYYHPEIGNRLNRIYALDKNVKECFDKLPGVAQKQYIKKSLIDEISISNSIEGVLSTRQEINDLIDDISSRVENKDRFYSVVKKYFLLMNDENIDLNTCKDIRDLYNEFLLDEIISENPKNEPDGEVFRKEHVYIEKTGGEVIHTGVNSETSIIQYMDVALSVLNNNDIDPILRTIIFHYLFEYIHPFYDGNGRMARFITSYVFSKTLTPIVGYRLSMNIKERLKEYYEAFKITNDKRNRGDIGSFAFIFLNIVIDSLEKTIEYADEKFNEFNEKMEEFTNLHKDFTKKELNYCNLLMQARIFSEFGITILDIQNVNHATIKTIRTIVQTLVDKKVAIKRRIGRKFYYSLR